MSDKVTKRPTPIEARPIRPLPMPEYGYQREPLGGFGTTSAATSPKSIQTTQNLDLSGVVLNLKFHE